MAQHALSGSKVCPITNEDDGKQAKNSIPSRWKSIVTNATTQRESRLENAIKVATLKERVRQDILRRISADASHLKTHNHLNTNVAARKESPTNTQGGSRRRTLLRSGITVTAFIFTGSIVLSMQEGWSFLDSLYFAIVTLTTVGFGDVSPKSATGKVFVIFYVFVGVAIISVALGILGEAIIDQLIALSDIGDEDDDQGASTTEKEKKRGILSGFMSPAVQKLAFALASVAIIDCIGVIFFMWTEEYSFVDAMYLCTIALTTVGYGDISPKTPASRGFACIWILVGTLLLARCVAVFVDFFVEGKKNELQQTIIRKPLTVLDLITADSDSSGSLSEAEFVLFKIQELGVVRQDYLIEIADEFRRLDRNRDGTLTLGELVST